MSEECDVETIGGVLEDSVARSILVHAQSEPMSASVLAERCDVSTVTIYRRLETLQEHDLVVASTIPERDGNHYKVYKTNVHQLTVSLTEDGFELSIKRTGTAADRLTRLIEEM
ncbi:winged helix-turn-helix domain-containing protein [Natronococcus sp. A-GB7]|uniref:winged helix-turn-helix domain-containing protein n=1 Tax=Natronococcus sp. A-GB7 TaxID=3037649 RepID=UPI00241CA9BC|nr:winged helix-turn-helix domain-containing protein [Natronococcus sp. A-GB7]MDG5821720.1 winged helix-turn-helix domain-containing protein [Natronococcus sp. A-GB7]